MKKSVTKSMLRLTAVFVFLLFQTLQFLPLSVGIGIQGETLTEADKNGTCISDENGSCTTASTSPPSMFQRLKESESRFGVDSPKTLEIVHDLAEELVNQKRNEEAADLYERATEGREQQLGVYHKATVASMYNYGVVLTKLSRWLEAESALQKALHGNEQSYGSEHNYTQNALYALGTLYLEQSKLDSAEKYYSRVKEIRERLLGENNTETLNSYYALATTYLLKGEKEKAEELYQKALIGRRKILGPDHIETVAAHFAVGISLLQQLKFNETIAHFSTIDGDTSKLLLLLYELATQLFALMFAPITYCLGVMAIFFFVLGLLFRDILSLVLSIASLIFQFFFSFLRY